MIDYVKLSNFKSFKSESIVFGGLTLFAGQNASGKSTVIQSLLLFKQADLSRETATLHLNGDYVKLGESSRLLYKWAENDLIAIEVGTSSGTFALEKLVNSGVDEADFFDTNISSNSVEQFGRKIRYLSANRITPDEVFPYSALRVAQRDLGPLGEHTVSYLAKNKTAPLEILKLAHPNDANYGQAGQILSNVNAWLQDISSGVDVSAKRVPGTNLADLRFGFVGGLDDVLSHNVGFGLTYTLPIVTLILSSEPGDILVIENPEAHVHPAGQIALGWLLALAAANGVQVIVETHSDHVFNGIRLFVKKAPEHHDKFRFYFVSRITSGGSGFESKVTSAEIDNSGRFIQSPNGFFDAWENAIFELI